VPTWLVCRQALFALAVVFVASNFSDLIWAFWFVSEMFFSRNHGPIRFIKENGVFLRPANIEDADQLIALNKAFRHVLNRFESESNRLINFVIAETCAK
jgi:hypothetical protein